MVACLTGARADLSLIQHQQVRRVRRGLRGTIPEHLNSGSRSHGSTHMLLPSEMTTNTDKCLLRLA